MITDRHAVVLGFLDYLGDGVIILDNTGLVCAVNHAAERILATSVSEMINQPCAAIFHCRNSNESTLVCGNACQFRTLWEEYNQKVSIRNRDISIKLKNGQVREINVSFAPFELPLLVPHQPADNNSVVEALEAVTTRKISAVPSETIIVLRDITEQKRQERIKAEFIATASHHLRAPLASIKTSIGLLLDNIDQQNFNPLLLRLLQNTNSSSLRMERLVNDLIELTNLQSGRAQMQRRPFKVAEMVENVVDLNHTRLEIKNQQLQVDPVSTQLFVEADYARISQVLNHLLSNAMKFSAQGGTIHLKVSTAENTQRTAHIAEVIFSVRDEGTGISAEDQDLIFEKFYQSQIEENSITVGGGLGLPLARALIELNGGRIWFESVEGQGSIFYFSLPLLQVEESV